MATPTPIGSEFQVNTHSEGHQQNTIGDGHFTNDAVAGLTNGDFVVAWWSSDQDGSGSGVFAQRYNSDGTKSGGEFQVNTYTTDSQYEPTVSGLSNGGFIIAWVSSEQDGSGAGVFAQRYNADGTTAGEEFQVNTYTTIGQDDPSVTGLSDGGFVVTWTSFQDGSLEGVFGQRFNANGTKAGDEFQVNTYTSKMQREAQVASLKDGGFVVVWESYQQQESGMGIFAQIYDFDGTRIGNEFRVETNTSGFQIGASVTGLNDGGFVVTFASESIDGSGYGISGQLFLADGTRVGDEFQVNTYTGSTQAVPCVTSLNEGGFVVTWHSFRQDGTSGHGIYGQRFDAGGERSGDEFQVNSSTTLNHEYSMVSGLSNGGFIVAWGTENNDGSDHDIFGRIFDAPQPVLVGGVLDSILGIETYDAFDAGANVDQVNALILPLFDQGSRWSKAPNSGSLTISYSFINGPDAARDVDLYDNGSLPMFSGTVTAFNGEQHGNVQQALTRWEDYTNVEFVSVSETSSLVGDIRFGMSTMLRSPESRAEAEPPAIDDAAAGDIWFQSDYQAIGNSTFAPGTAEFRTTLHEIGHAVFGYTDVSALAGLGRQLGNDWDISTWTVMSYNRDVHPDPITPMFLDILAAHAIYGDVDIFTGDNTYTVNSDSILTIWDDGGIDTIVWEDDDDAVLSLRTYSTGASVNPLSDLGWSGVYDGAIDWRFFISPGSLVENLTGGLGNDGLEGNSANNILNGRAGNDLMIGGAGNDRFIVNSSDDQVRENASEGLDTVQSSVSFNLNQNSQHIENLFLANGPGIKGIGNSADNVITGQGGANELIGAGGNDILNGGLGNDNLNGGAGNDRLNGGFGDDRMIGGLGDDVYVVNASTDRAVEFPNQGHDRVVSNASTYSLLAQSNNIEDLLLGGSGDIDGNGNNANNLIGGNNGANTLNGGLGNDVLIGRAGIDTLNGGAGDDVLNGGADNDTLNGGLDNDRFVFDGQFGNDLILGFSTADDVIDLRAVAGITDFTDLEDNHLSQVGPSAVITDGTNTITVNNIAMASLAADDFWF